MFFSTGVYNREKLVLKQPSQQQQQQQQQTPKTKIKHI